MVMVMPRSRPSDRLPIAARHVVDYYCPPDPKLVVILYHLGHARIAQALEAEFSSRGSRVSLIQTDDLEVDWRDLRATIESAIADADLVLNCYFLRYDKDEWRSERISFLRELIRGSPPAVTPSKYRLMKDLDEDTFVRIFSVDPQLIRHINQALLAITNRASEWRVTSRLGTDLTVQLDKTTWPLIDYNGFGELDYELPPGEILTHPASVDGSLVLAGLMIGTLPIGRKYGCLEQPLLRIEFEGGTVQRVHSPVEELQTDVRFCLSVEDGLTKVGEVATGTHIGMSGVTGLNYEYEERYPGFHLGLGVSQVDEAIGGQRQSEHHLDFVLLNSTISFGDVCVMQDGQFSDTIWRMVREYQ
jgi:hypothetical protein